MKASIKPQSTPLQNLTVPDKVYSLLYVNDQHNNNKDMAAKSALSIYVSCASLVANSARRAGIDFTILTNNGSRLMDAASKAHIPPFNVREIAFELAIPKGVRYFQAHYKISVMKSFGTGDFGEHPTLVDSDIFIRKSFLDKVRSHKLVAYDVSHKAAHLSHDLAILVPPVAGHRQWWAGGEFISGTSASFALLAEHVEALLPKYLKNINSFIHVSDETPVSAALNQLTNQGFAVVDAGKQLEIIARWHSSRTFIAQEKLSDLWRRDVLHLPADKKFLASMAGGAPDDEEFFTAYKKYAGRKIRIRTLVNPFLNLVKSKQIVPVV